MERGDAFQTRIPKLPLSSTRENMMKVEGTDFEEKEDGAIGRKRGRRRQRGGGGGTITTTTTRKSEEWKEKKTDDESTTRRTIAATRK